MGEAYAYRPAGAPTLTTPAAGPVLPGSPRSAYTRVGGSADVAELLTHGERALRAGLAADAVSAFRGATYLAPDLPLPHLELGLALYALGEKAAARRALQTARRVLGSSTGDVAGWDAAALRRRIDERLAAVEADT